MKTNKQSENTDPEFDNHSVREGQSLNHAQCIDTYFKTNTQGRRHYRSHREETEDQIELQMWNPSPKMFCEAQHIYI
jgi:hypothetical protein